MIKRSEFEIPAYSVKEEMNFVVGLMRRGIEAIFYLKN